MNDQNPPIFVANGEIDAQQVRAFLKASGIDCTMRGEALTERPTDSRSTVWAESFSFWQSTKIEQRHYSALLKPGSFGWMWNSRFSARKVFRTFYSGNVVPRPRQFLGVLHTRAWRFRRFFFGIWI